MSKKACEREQLAWLLWHYRQGYSDPLRMADEILALLHVDPPAGGTMTGETETRTEEQPRMFTTGTSPQAVVNQVSGVLTNLRNSLAAAKELQLSLAGVSIQDLIAFGFAVDPNDDTQSPDAQAIKSAVADADGFAQLFDTGTDSRDPGAGYIYGQSIRAVIGTRQT